MGIRIRKGDNHLKILITGANGQLGKELDRQLKRSHTVFALYRVDLDITKREEVEKVINKIKPQVIIHAAAYTAVDQCEIDRKRTFEVNCLGTGNVVVAARKIGARIIYISSDYVFDGKKQSPYTEEDAPNPQSIYGMSKWLGEELVLGHNDGTVIRTSWLYGHDGKNFVKTMLRLGKLNKEIKVVNDQVGSPTFVKDLSETIGLLLNKKGGIYHVTNSGYCTWYEFAKAIFKEAGLDSNLVVPTSSKEYRALANRPSYSVLGHHALKRENVQLPRDWNEALKDYIRKESVQ